MYDATANEVEVLEADLQRVEARIEKTKVRAPFSGVVGLRAVSEGAYVTPQTQVATLKRLDPTKVDFSVAEKHASRVQSGQPVSVAVRGMGRAVDATVYATDAQIDPGTRTFQVRVRTDNLDRRLRPGMFADVTVTLGTIDSTVVVPSFSVVPTLDGQRVFVVDDGRAQPRNVEIGIRTDSTVQVTVITSGIQDLRAGLPVRIGALE